VKEAGRHLGRDDFVCRWDDDPRRQKRRGPPTFWLAGLVGGPQRRHPQPNGDCGQTVVDHIRLFPVREGVRWTYAVQEQILPALRRANVPVRWTDLSVRHTGYTDPALRNASSSGIARSSMPSWPRGLTTRSSSST